AWSEGTVLQGRYELHERLSSAGGSQVWSAVDLSSGQKMRLRAHCAGALPRGAMMRIEHDAALLKELNSAYVMPVLDSWWQEECFVTVCALSEGQPLAQLLQRGPLNLHDAIGVGI